MSWPLSTGVSTRAPLSPLYCLGQRSDGFLVYLLHPEIKLPVTLLFLSHESQGEKMGLLVAPIRWEPCGSGAEASPQKPQLIPRGPGRPHGDNDGDVSLLRIQDLDFNFSHSPVSTTPFHRRSRDKQGQGYMRSCRVPLKSHGQHEAATVLFSVHGDVRSYIAFGSIDKT